MQKPTDSMTDTTRSLSDQCVFPPPWNIERNPARTRGWIAFQRAQTDDPEYYWPAWIDASEHLPKKEGEIVFMARFGLTIERIGIALPESRIVLLSHTEIDFADLLAWFPMPELPHSMLEAGKS